MSSRHVKATIIRRISIIIGIFMLFAGCASLLPQETPEAEKAVEPRTISRIESKSMADADQVVIHASDSLDYTSVKQLNPIGVIFYFPGTQLGAAQTQYAPESDLIEAINLSASEDQNNVRMEVKLSENVPYEAVKEAGKLTISFDRSGMGGASAADSPKKQEPSQSTQPEKAEMQATAQEAVKVEPKEGEFKGLAVIQEINFTAKESGKSAVSIESSTPVAYDLAKINDRRLKLSLHDAALPSHIDQRPLITTRFDSALDRLIPYAAGGGKNIVEIIIELREAVPYRIERGDGQLVLHFDASTIGPRPYAMANLPDWQQVLEESVQATAVEPAELKKQAKQEKPDEMEWLFEKEEYTGQKIVLDFYETDIKNVFRILQQVSGKNYAIDPDVQGQVTISMEKPVPYDQVLDLILKQNKLGKVERGDIVRIATLSTLRAEEEAKQQQFQAYQQRKEQEKALEPLFTEYIPINYANAEKEIQSHIKDVLSDRGKVTVDARNNQLIITDIRESIAKAQEVIAQIDKVTPQVIIEARVVEINEDFLKDIGTEFAVQSEDVFRSDLGGDYSYDVAMNHPGSATSSIGFNFTRLSALGTPLVLDARLSALEQDSQLKIISSPKVITLDNKKATITQGFEYPYQTVEDDDVQVEFKDIDLTLEVTPHVTPDKRISLEIWVTKNDIAEFIETIEGRIPALSTNEARTELLVDDGNTIVIGGVKKNTENKSSSGFPILKDIPILGWAFKNETSEITKSELLIFLTPRIVQLEQRGLTAITSDQY